MHLHQTRRLNAPNEWFNHVLYGRKVTSQECAQCRTASTTMTSLKPIVDDRGLPADDRFIPQVSNRGLTHYLAMTCTQQCAEYLSLFRASEVHSKQEKLSLLPFICFPKKSGRAWGRTRFSWFDSFSKNTMVLQYLRIYFKQKMYM